MAAAEARLFTKNPRQIATRVVTRLRALEVEAELRGVLEIRSQAYASAVELSRQTAPLECQRAEEMYQLVWAIDSVLARFGREDLAGLRNQFVGLTVDKVRRGETFSHANYERLAVLM
jgi:hypothetical protein